MFPIYNSNDPGSVVSQEEAIVLIKNRIKEAQEISYGLQVIKPGRTSDDDIRFHSAYAESQALEWVMDLVKRIVPDPSNHRRAMIKVAESLESEANHLRRQASTIQSPEPSSEN